jgi:protocatechuate 4,5-dioxygenase alpha chain
MLDDIHDWNIPGTYVFDSVQARAGYPINKMCTSLTNPENRILFAQDETAYMDRFKLSDAQKKAVLARDWLSLVKLGGNIYYMIKIGASVGHGLYTMGAQMRGETLEEFLKTRSQPGAT